MFKALLLEQNGTQVAGRVVDLHEASLPEGQVQVRIDYSTLNYKDGLAITGRSPVVRIWPMVPGIDFAGCVEFSSDDRFRKGDRVVLNGWGAGETQWGGLSQRARVSADHLVPLPAGLSARQAMAIGTAGYTAMLAVQALERNGVLPGSGEILVTGANGGVGGFATSILAQRGYRVTASTGRVEEAPRLLALGASSVIDRATLSEKGKPLQKERWAGVIDSLGGHTLANACASSKYGGTVAACGLAQSMDLPATVAPFILRGVILAGIDSVFASYEKRVAAWRQLSLEMNETSIARVADEEISLEQCVVTAGELIAGRIKGRVIVNPNL